MKDAIRHLDQHFAAYKPLLKNQRPAKGWLRAIRDALGMTSKQLGERLGIAQPSVVELEQAEARGTITLKTLERTAEALGCRVVYALVPTRPLADTVRERAETVARKKLLSVQHTMRLENQEVRDDRSQREAMTKLIDELMRRPARLWDDP